MRERETHGGAVVDLLLHVGADAAQLRLCDVLHRPHHVGGGQRPRVQRPASRGLEHNRAVSLVAMVIQRVCVGTWLGWFVHPVLPRLCSPCMSPDVNVYACACP